MPDDNEDKTIYKVVVNHEEQYSTWPAHRENALGWKDAGKSGTKDQKAPGRLLFNLADATMQSSKDGYGDGQHSGGCEQ